MTHCVLSSFSRGKKKKAKKQDPNSSPSTFLQGIPYSMLLEVSSKGDLFLCTFEQFMCLFGL